MRRTGLVTSMCARAKNEVGDHVARMVRATLNKDSVQARFAWGACWSLTGALFSQGCALAVSIVAARLLGKAGFGALGMVQTTVGMLGVFAGMGLGLTGTKYVAELRVADPGRVGRVISLCSIVALCSGGLISVLLITFAPRLASSTLNAPHLSEPLRIGTALLFLNTLIGSQTGVLGGFERFRAIAGVNLARGLITLSVSVPAVLLWGLSGAVWALAIAAAATWVLNHIAIRKACRANGVSARWEEFWTEREVLWKFSTPATLSGALTGPVMWAASTILVNQPNGYSEMGIFNAASQWRFAIAFLPSVFSQPLLALLSNARGARESRSFAQLMRVNLLFTLALTASLGLAVIIGSSWIMKAYGQGFLSGQVSLRLLVLATVISSTATVIGQGIASLGRMWLGFVLNFVWALVLVAGALAWAPRYGATGLSGAFLVAYLAHAATSTYVYFSLVGKVPLLRSPELVAKEATASEER